MLRIYTHEGERLLPVAYDAETMSAAPTNAWGSANAARAACAYTGSCSRAPPDVGSPGSSPHERPVL